MTLDRDLLLEVIAKVDLVQLPQADHPLSKEIRPDGAFAPTMLKIELIMDALRPSFAAKGLNERDLLITMLGYSMLAGFDIANRFRDAYELKHQNDIH